MLAYLWTTGWTQRATIVESNVHDSSIKPFWLCKICSEFLVGGSVQFRGGNALCGQMDLAKVNQIHVAWNAGLARNPNEKMTWPFNFSPLSHQPPVTHELRMMEHSKTRIMKRLRDFNWLLCIRAGGVICVLLAILQTIPLSNRAAPLKTWSCKNVLLHETHFYREHAGHPIDVIPNLVHFVYLVEDASNPDITFSLRRFIAIFSAHHYLRPETIYIHTNLNQDIIDTAWETSDDSYFNAVRQIPNVRFNRHLSLNMTSTNNTIDRLQKQSAFLRTDVLKKFGGIYLDDDSYVLRDLRPFRHMGYEMVTGRQNNGQICPAVLLSTPNNAMITAYHALQDTIEDGVEATDATDLLTALVYDFAEPDYMSLILPPDTFFPGSWNKEDLRWIYQQHREPDIVYPQIQTNRPTTNLTDFITHYTLDSKLGFGFAGESTHAWHHDWRLSYVIHGWTSGLGNEFDKEEVKELFGVHGDITLEYVLEKRSNFARAVYPAVQHALDTGILSIYQELKVLKESSMNNGTDYRPVLSEKERKKMNSEGEKYALEVEKQTKEKDKEEQEEEEEKEREEVGEEDTQGQEEGGEREKEDDAEEEEGEDEGEEEQEEEKEEDEEES